mmetsp:Transcript_4709/g.5662  ORF Transcript_4709/g.5662 Transcript_4709/m.5662 type:complete len:121 (+) Transcript_4709:105-467(+)
MMFSKSIVFAAFAAGTTVSAFTITPPTTISGRVMTSSSTSLYAMEEDEMMGKVQKIVSAQLGIEESKVKSESSFQGELGADSLDLVELVMTFENEFDTEIQDEDAGQIVTVGDAIKLLSA